MSNILLKTFNKGGGRAIFFFILFFFLYIGLVCDKAALSADEFNQDILKKAENKWGEEAGSRFQSWIKLIQRNNNYSEKEMLEKVNRFVNKVAIYAEDIDVWGVDDYWATPVEFIGKGKGDCEDYAITKFFTLKAMGVLEEKLNISYVKSIPFNRMHMVLTYVDHLGAEPFILDNLIDSITLASDRNDLVPVFSFNGTELWMAHERNQERSINSSRLRPWRDLLKRMPESALFIK